MSEKSSKSWKNYIKPEEIEALSKTDPVRIARDTTLAWFFILASLAAFAATGSFWVFVMAVFVIAIQQHHLTTFVHEASHYNIVEGKRDLNDFVSDYLYAGPILVTTGSYRARHAQHHKHLGVAGVDDETNDRHLISPHHFWKNVFLCLSGLRAVRSFLGHTQASAEEHTQENKLGGIIKHYVPICISNLALLGWCWLWGNPFAYILLWLAPLATVTTLIVMLRVIVEHQSDEYSLREDEDFEHDIPHPVTRTIDPPPWEKWVFGPLNFCYHHEHHLFPAMPYTNLPKLYALLKERGYYGDHADSIGTTYCAVLRTRMHPSNIKASAAAA